MLRQGIVAIVCFISSVAVALPIYSPSQMDVIHKRGYIRVGIVGIDENPFVIHHKNGQLTGIDIELANKIAELLDVKVVYDTSADSYEALLQNAFDKKDDIVISALVSVPSRAKSVFFSDTYLKSPIGLLVNRVKYDYLKKNEIPSFDDSAIKIGTIEGSAYVGYIEFLYPKAKIIPFKTTDELFDAVSQGQLDACMLDDLIIKVWLAQKPERAIKTRYIILPGFYADYAVATSYAYPFLGDWLSNVVNEAINLGFIDQLIKKYAGDV